MTSNARWFLSVSVAVVTGAAGLFAACGSSGSDGLKDVPEGALAPASATMKWEQEIPASTTPAHIIRRFTSSESPAAVTRFYAEELDGRGWTAAPGNGGGYAEWSRDGMVISLVFDAVSGGSEWSLALFAAD